MLDAIELTLMSLGLVLKVLNTINVIFSIHEGFRTINPDMVEVAHIQGVVRRNGIGIHNTVRLNALLDDMQNRLRAGIGDDEGIDFFQSFHESKYRHITRNTATMFALAYATVIALVWFNPRPKACK